MADISVAAATGARDTEGALNGSLSTALDTNGYGSIAKG
jgi:hypothetical protein